MSDKSKGLDYLLIALVAVMVSVGITFTIAQIIAYKREVVRQADIAAIKNELSKTAPADVLLKTNEVLEQTHRLLIDLKQAREEFASTRFTSDDGEKMDKRVKNLETQIQQLDK